MAENEKPIPPVMSAVAGEDVPKPAPATLLELMAAIQETVQCAKRAADLQAQFGFYVTQLQDPNLGTPDLRIMLLPKGVETLARYPGAAIPAAVSPPPKTGQDANTSFKGTRKEIDDGIEAFL